MILDEKGHVTWTGLNEYDDVKTCVEWREAYGAAMQPEAQEFLKRWITRKLAHEQLKAEGQIVSTTRTTQYGCITAPGFRQADWPG